MIAQLSLLLGLALARAGDATVAIEPTTEAAEPADVDGWVARARTRFDAGDFDGAIADFEQAYALRPDGSYVYNIARIHEEAGRLEAAIAGYRRFIRAPGVALEQRAQALERIEVLERVRDASREPVHKAEPVPPPRPVERTEPDRTDDVAPPPATDAGRTAIRVGIGLLGSGAAVMIGGAVAAGLALRDDRSLATTDDPSSRREIVGRGRGEAIAADVLLSTGGALAIAGIATLATGVVRRRQALRRSSTARIRVGDGLTLRF